MAYTITGSIRGMVGEHFEDPLTGGTLRLYHPQNGTDEESEQPARTSGGQVETGRVQAQHKGIQILEDAEVEEKSERGIEQTRIGENGTFTVTLGEKEGASDWGRDEDYEGGPVEVDVRLEHLPRRDPPEDVDPVQFTVGTIMPEWREAETGMKATWDHRLTTKQWCGIQALFGLWTVYGQVTDTLFGWPVQYATVRAFDADIVEDDLIGSDTTDATGHYRIDYMRSTFEKTPSPWPPIELESGPDFFFSIEKGGDVLHKENRSEGRTPGREDASHCERIDLEAPPFDFLTPTLWTGIGDTFTVPSSPTDLNDMDKEGYLGSGNFALTGRPALTGNISETEFMDRRAPGNTDSIEYRFVVFDQTEDNTKPTPPKLQNASNGTPVTAGLFEETTIGEIQYFPSGGEVSIDVTVEQPHVGSDGWINVRSVVDDAFSGPDTGPATDLEDALRNHGPVYYDDKDPLVRLDTTAVTTQSRPSSNPGDIGSALPAGTTPLESIAIRFETRPSGATSPNRGKTVNSVVVNNTRIFREMEVFDASGNPVGCNKQSGNMTVKFNVYHPHLRDAKLTVAPNDGSAEEIAPPDASSPPDEVVPGTNTDPATESVSGSFDITSELDKTCAYSVKFWTQRRLHNGDSAVSGDGSLEEVFFYKDTP